MNLEIRRLQPSDELLALQIVRDLMPIDEREGREPSIDHLRRLRRHDTKPCFQNDQRASRG